MALIAMEPPASFDADAVRNEKVKVLSAVRPIDVYDTVCAQYEGYRQVKGVAPDSQTPTFAALKLNIDNWRWQGVPFYLRSGKALKQKITEITVVFREPPHMLFNNGGNDRFACNSLSICVQPDEGIHLSFEAKVPDSVRNTRSVEMEFHYADSFEGYEIPEAYERLILDALVGDASLFTRSDGIDVSWQIMDPIIESWESDHGPELSMYKPGSWGPVEADELLTTDGREWVLGCVHNGAK
ncbi:MAG: glucose-6-phosphate dehydrogenase, partial [Anaerolineae bacterium]|nr:glucose-6-phosphate dehydrogenase [Anaerolineae bacterium]